MIACPKCESKNTLEAPDENPGWAKRYMKCFACGMRWDAAGLPPRDEREQDEARPKADRSQDILALVMKTAREQPAVQQKETAIVVPVAAYVRKPHRMSPAAREKIAEAQRRRHAKAGHNMTKKEELTMSGPASQDRRCTEILNSGKPCPAWPKKGEDVCLRHFEKRTAKQAGNRKKLLPSVTTLPAKRPNAPIVMAEPTMVNAPIPTGSVSFVAIDAMIINAEQDLAALRRVRGIVEREVQ